MQKCKVEIIPNVVAGNTPYQQYTDEEKTLIGVPISGSDQSLFDPNDPEEGLEVSVYDLNGDLLGTLYNYTDYTVTDDTNTEGKGAINTLNLNPEKILAALGIAFGTYLVISRFLKNQLGTSQENPALYIEEISPDRQEVRLNSTTIPSDSLVSQSNQFSSSLADDSYFEDFYLNLGNNNLYIANNILVDTQTNPDNPSVLVHLYEPLPDNIQLNNTLYIVTEQADPLNLNVELPPEAQPLDVEPEEVPYLQGPNFGIEIQSQFNNPTDFVSYNDLTSVPLTSSYNQLQNILKKKGINVPVNYTEFDNFVHFSSAKQRLNNFYYKVGLIESASFELTNLNNTGGGQNVSSSKSAIETTISNIISNFDGFENYMYYNSNSLAWPKTNTEPPYILYSTGSVEVVEWFGSDEPYNQYFGGRILTASDFDNLNPNVLVKTIPEYLREDPDNAPYDLFINMIGQHFDDLYLYTKNVTNRYNNDNRLDAGISKDLVAQALRDFGIKLYQNNFSSNDLYSAFLGINGEGSLLPPTGSEVINNYITGSDQAVPLNDVNKEFYKRIYHNLPYLLKKKGTIEGLRALITCFGVPTTTLRISEFGGKDRINANDWDYFYQKYGKALITSDGLDEAYVKAPWLPLNYNLINNEEFKVPDTVTFRFKTTGIPPESNYSQSLWIVGTEKLTNDSNLDSDQNFDIGLFLFYTGSWALNSGSWSGSIQSPYKEYGDLQLILRKGENLEYITSSKVNLPFFNGDWWSVMVRRNDSFNLDNVGTPTTYDIIAKSKPYNGADGTLIAFQDSASLDNTDGGFDIADINSSWAYFSQSSAVGTGTIFQPGAGYGSRFGFGGIRKKVNGEVKLLDETYFSGSIQEIRYYNLPLSESVFDDYVMNPESVEGIAISGSGSSFDMISFRAGLGDELLLPTNNSQGDNQNFQVFTSIHPSITSSYGAITGSFVVADMDDTPNPQANYTITSDYYIRDNQEVGGDVNRYALRNDEVFYIDQPVVGIKNRITDKIRLENTSILGNTLSSVGSTELNPITNKSYTRDINYLEVAFSPQNEINDDIVASLGYFDIGNYIGDPRQISQSTYPDLEVLREEYFKKYYKNYNLADYVRLIKYFDNSLFKMIKDFVPARTGVATGVVIKQHLLERNKYVTPQATFNLPNYSESIDTAFIEGGNGGAFNLEGKNKFTYLYPAQSFTEEINTVGGAFTKTHTDESEYFNGELGGTHFEATDGEVGPEEGFEPLYGNAEESTRSNLYYTVEYDQGSIIPSNLDKIIDGTAEPADVEDFNYYSKRSTIPRYEGSKHTATAFGERDRNSKLIPVDPGSVYFTNIVKAYDTSPEFINKTFISIDKFVTQNSDVYDPRNNTIPQHIDFKHTFKIGDTVNVKIDALNDVRTYDELPGKHDVLKIGRYNTLLATNQSTASAFASSFAEGASGSRIGRIKLVSPDAVDQGDAIIVLPVDPGEEIPTPINFKFIGKFIPGTIFKTATNSNGDPDSFYIYGDEFDIPEEDSGGDIENRSGFGITGWWENNDTYVASPGPSRYYDNSSVNINQFPWAETGIEVYTYTNPEPDPSIINLADGRFAVCRFLKSTQQTYQNIKVKFKFVLKLANLNILANSDTAIYLRVYDNNGSIIAQQQVVQELVDGTLYDFILETGFVHVPEGGYVSCFIKTQKNQIYIVPENGGFYSRFEIIPETQIQEPVTPEAPEPESLPIQKFLNYYTADMIDPDAFNKYGLAWQSTITAVGLEPPLFNNLENLQILSSSQTSYFSRGPYQIAQQGGDPITVIPPSSSRGYDQNIVIPFNPQVGDEIRWVYDENYRSTIISMSSGPIPGNTYYPESAGEPTLMLHLDNPITTNFWAANGQNFIITRVTDNNSGFMLNIKKPYPDVGDSTTKESYVTPLLISEKLDNNLYSIVRDLSDDRGVF